MSEIPAEVLTNPEPKNGGKYVVATPEIVEAFGPENDAVTVFKAVDETFMDDPEAHLKTLEESVFSFRSSTGANIPCSLIPGKGNRLLVIWAPFSDCAPKSNAEQMYRWMIDDPLRPIGKVRAAPNSWSQITKSAVIADLLKAVDHDMPVLTIFSPLPSIPLNAYTHAEYKKIRRGNFSPSARITKEAIAHAQDRLHGPRSETRLAELNLQGASLGASNAIGAANGLLGLLLPEDRTRIRSVTAQELIIGPKSTTADLGQRFMLKDPIGEPSDLPEPEDTPRIPEPKIRQLIEREGNEPAMFLRMVRGMSKLSRLKGLTRPEHNYMPRLVENLLVNDVSVMLPLGENSGVTFDTPKYLPGSGEKVVKVKAVEGERTAHMIDEHVGLTALLAVMHVVQSTRN